MTNKTITSITRMKKSLMYKRIVQANKNAWNQLIIIIAITLDKNIE